jgi:hypothetical protein
MQSPKDSCYFLPLFFNGLMLKLKMLQYLENTVTIYQVPHQVYWQFRTKCTGSATPSVLAVLHQVY